MSDNLEQKAREIGWRPKEEFRGDPEKWVEAGEYLRRGEEVLPLVKAENRHLKDKTDTLTREVAQLKAVVTEQSRSMTDLVDFSRQQLKDKLAEQKRQLTAELRAATREDDETRIALLEEQLEENAEARDKLKAPKPEAAAPAAPQTIEETPEYRAFVNRNPWFNGTSAEDREKTVEALALAQAAAASGKKGEAFFTAVEEKMNKLYPPQKRTDPSEEGRPSGGAGGGGNPKAGSAFKDLPADAKATAKAQAARFVGPNKIFKTEAAWFDHFAEQYNQG
jgi:hypothetical protein